jgi:hypothetical protein
MTIDVYKILDSLQEGDTLEHGRLFSFDKDEPLVWSCIEIIPVGGAHRRYTFHVYAFGVMLRSVVATLDDSLKQVEWRNAELN